MALAPEPSAAKLALAARQARSDHASADVLAAEPIALIGVGCRFPGGGDSPDAYWQALARGVDAIREVPADRWDVEAFYDPDPSAPGKMSTRWGAFLDRVDGFDAGLLRHRAARGGAHGPAAAPAARSGVGGARGRRAAAGPARRQPDAACSSPCTAATTPRRGPSDRRERIDAYTQLGTAHSIAAGRLSYLARPARAEPRASTRPVRRRWSPCTSPARACGAASAISRWPAASA